MRQSNTSILEGDYDMLTLRYLARINDPRLFDSTLMVINLETDETRMKQTLAAIEEIKLKYDVDKLEFQKASLEKGITQKNIIIGVIIIAFLIALVAIGIISYLYREQQKQLDTLYKLNEQLAQRRPLDANLPAPESLLVEEVSTEAVGDEATDEDDSSSHPALYQIILHRLETKRLYIDPLFSIHDLCNELKRNRKIISKCIKEQGNISFTVLVNQYRVNEARRLIREKGTEQTLNEIAEMAGFNNRITFYRCFKDSTGFSPSAYLDRVRQEAVGALEDTDPADDDQ